LNRPGILQRSAPFFAVIVGVLGALGCSPKKSKPVHSEPWLAHPPASAQAAPDAAIATTRYRLDERSVIRLELATKRGKVHGKLTRVHGEFEIALGALSQSRGQVQAELDSLALDGDDDANAADWLARAQSALGLADGGARVGALATFDVTALDDVSPEVIEPAHASDAGTTAPRRARAIADGDFLLHGFRVQKRAPLEAEFSFGSDLEVPAAVVIRSRGPLVVSLETHEIHLHGAENARKSGEKRRNRAAESGHDVRVSVELYGTKD